jgi:uncharacterized protein (UPF0261 family)
VPVVDAGVRLHARGASSAIVALGGSGGASVAACATAAVPLGFPELLVSTDTRQYVATGDVAR